MQTALLIAALFIVGAHAASTKPSETASSSSQVGVVVSSQQVPIEPRSPQQQQQGAEINQGPGQHPHYPPFSSYYQPAGVVTVVGEQQGKPPGTRNFEQYGQPESSSLPPNYKPWGSFGLYIGGNPADGYYTNYYKSLSESAGEKQEKPAILKASPASGSSYSPTSSVVYYPYVYSQGDFAAPHYEHASVSEGYSVPKKASISPAIQKEGVKGEAKEYVQPQSRVYVYAQPTVANVATPIVSRAMIQEQHQQQVAVYPVPVGSQILGSQPGVEGSFYPYGVHAFTRYVVKPTIVGQEGQSISQQSPAVEAVHQSTQAAYPIQAASYPNQAASYPSQMASYPSQAVQQTAYRAYYAPSYYPYYSGNYYGYPVSQLHYSPSIGEHQEHQNVHHHVGIMAGKPYIAAESSPSQEIKPVESVPHEKA